MADDKEFNDFRKAVIAEINKQAKRIQVLEKQVETLEKDLNKEIKKTKDHSTGLISKLSRLVDDIRRKQVIDRQKANDIDRTVQALTRRK